MRDLNKNLIESVLPIKGAEIVPHRGIMLLIDELTECSSEHAVGMSVVTSKNPFLDSKGKLEGVCYVELLAQLAAACRGYEMLKASAPVKGGYLTGVNDFIISKQASVGDLLCLRFNKTLELENVLVIDGCVYLNHECLASGRLKIHLTEMELTASMSDSDNGKSADDINNLTQVHSNIMLSSIRKCIKKQKRCSMSNIATGTFCFDKSFPVFDGHFPGFAVLPGVVMIDLSLVLCEDLLQCQLVLHDIEMAKFTNPIFPGDMVEAEVSVVENNGIYRVRAKLISGDKIVSNLLFSAGRDIQNP